MSRFHCAGYVERTATRLKDRHWTIPGGRSCCRNNQRTRNLQRASAICTDESQENASSRTPAPPIDSFPPPKIYYHEFARKIRSQQASRDQVRGETGEAKGAEVSATIPSVEALVEVDGVLAGNHLVLSSTSRALLPLRHCAPSLTAPYGGW